MCVLIRFQGKTAKIWSSQVLEAANILRCARHKDHCLDIYALSPFLIHIPFNFQFHAAEPVSVSFTVSFLHFHFVLTVDPVTYPFSFYNHVDLLSIPSHPRHTYCVPLAGFSFPFPFLFSFQFTPTTLVLHFVYAECSHSFQFHFHTTFIFIPCY
jgi:hypothetical protein